MNKLLKTVIVSCAVVFGLNATIANAQIICRNGVTVVGGQAVCKSPISVEELERHLFSTNGDTTPDPLTSLHRAVHQHRISLYRLEEAQGITPGQGLFSQQLHRILELVIEIGGPDLLNPP